MRYRVEISFPEIPNTRWDGLVIHAGTVAYEFDLDRDDFDKTLRSYPFWPLVVTELLDYALIEHGDIQMAQVSDSTAQEEDPDQ